MAGGQGGADVLGAKGPAIGRDGLGDGGRGTPTVSGEERKPFLFQQVLEPLQLCESPEPLL